MSKYIANYSAATKQVSDCNQLFLVAYRMGISKLCMIACMMQQRRKSNDCYVRTVIV